MLRNIKNLFGYRIHAEDGNIGEAYDFFFDDETWAVRYLVARYRYAQTSLPPASNRVAQLWIDNVRWEESKVYVDLPKEMIENSPKYDTSLPVNREYEIALYEYYCRPKYWV